MVLVKIKNVSVSEYKLVMGSYSEAMLINVIQKCITMDCNVYYYCTICIKYSKANYMPLFAFALENGLIWNKFLPFRVFLKFQPSNFPALFALISITLSEACLVFTSLFRNTPISLFE